MDWKNQQVGHAVFGTGAVAALENQVQKIGGFVESHNVTGDTQYNADGTTTVVNRWAYYTVRIPCDHF